MKKIINKPLGQLSSREKQQLLSRAAVDFDALEPKIKSILDTVRRKKDKGLIALTKEFDHCTLKSLWVTPMEIKQAFKDVEPGLIKTFKHIIANLRKFYEAEKPREWSVDVDRGIRSGMLYRPYERVGFYVPGRKARFPTITLRMCVPAIVAGVKDIVLCSPPDHDGKISSGVLIAADLLGIKEVYKIGGAQAVAALTYGTETIKPVQKISAVGSPYVVAAQKMLFGQVGIEKLAGPSDAMILCDKTAHPQIVAANFLTEIEHGPTSGTVALVPSRAFAQQLEEAIMELVKQAPPQQQRFFETSLYTYSGILIYDSLAQAMDFVNDYAPEHLQLTLKDPKAAIAKAQNVGAIQNGPYTMIASGDFFGGTANVLPTGGLAKIFSDVSVMDFLKKIPVQVFSKQGFLNIADQAQELAQYQQMFYHAKSIQLRKTV